MANIKHDFNIALAEAFTANNALYSVNGYSANQLALGRSPEISMVLNGRFATLVRKGFYNEIIATNLNERLNHLLRAR